MAIKDRVMQELITWLIGVCRSQLPDIQMSN